jgi:hypothetical protein
MINVTYARWETVEAKITESRHFMPEKGKYEKSLNFFRHRVEIIISAFHSHSL